MWTKKLWSAQVVMLLVVTAHAQNTFPTSGGNVGIGTTNPTSGALQIAAPDQSVESAIAIRQSNSVGYGFDLALDQQINGMGFILGVSGGTRTALMQFDRTNNRVGIGTLPPQAKFHISDNAKLFSTTNNEYDSNVEIQGTSTGKSIGQGPALGFVVPANTDGTNPWEMARILASPDNTTNAYAHGRMYLQTRTLAGSAWTWNNNLVLTSSGNVGIGTTTPGAALEVNGNVQLSSGSGGSIRFADGTVQSTAWNGTLCGGDYAETVNASGDHKKYEPGDVLVLSSDSGSDVSKSSQSYSTLVGGIYSTKPGVVGRRQIGEKSDVEIPMAMVGIVPTKVSAENGPIRRGDLLVTSSTEGYAMKGTDQTRMLGAIVGKAIGSLDSGLGVIEVLVSLQ